MDLPVEGGCLYLDTCVTSTSHFPWRWKWMLCYLVCVCVCVRVGGGSSVMCGGFVCVHVCKCGVLCFYWSVKVNKTGCMSVWNIAGDRVCYPNKAPKVCVCVCVYVCVWCTEAWLSQRQRKVTSRARLSGTVPGDCAREPSTSGLPRTTKCLSRRKKKKNAVELSDHTLTHTHTHTHLSIQYIGSHAWA